MSDQAKPEAPSDERLAAIYGASPNGKVEVEDPGEMHRPTYDLLIKQGRTPEYAEEQARHQAHVRRQYSRSIARGHMG